MKEIVLISGKGGTGKTSLSAAFAMLGGKDLVVGDCDVDAADMHLLLEPDFAHGEDFYSGYQAYIEEKDCTQCGVCAEVCRFDAIKLDHSKYHIGEIDCEGCGYCKEVCPDDAIIMKDNLSGKLLVSETKAGNTMVHARLGIAAENSGKLVAKVKKEASRIAKENETNYVLIDGSPGIGCPVISSLTGADFVVLITEPTVSGLHDLQRVYEVVKRFRIPAGCIINKSDLNINMTSEIKNFLNDEGILHISDLPYDENFTHAMTLGKTIVEYDSGNLSQIIVESWKKLTEFINKNLKQQE